MRQVFARILLRLGPWPSQQARRRPTRALPRFVSCATSAGAVLLISERAAMAQPAVSHCEKELSLDGAKQVLRDVIGELDKDEVQEVIGTQVLEANGEKQEIIQRVMPLVMSLQVG